MANYSSVSIDGSVPHCSRWLDARNSAADFIQIAVPAGLTGVLTIEGTDDTSVVLAENALGPVHSDDTAATVTDVTSSCTFDGSLTGAGPKLLKGKYSASKAWLRVRWVQSVGAGTIVVLVSDNTDQQESVLDGMEVSNGLIDVRYFVPEGEELDGDNIVAAITAAKAVAYGLASEAQSWCYDVYVPVGRYVISGPLATFAGTGINTPTPGLVGAGTNATVFEIGGLTDSQYALDFGGEGIGEDTYRQRIRGFELQGSGGSALGNGIRITAAYDLDMEDVRVSGFQNENTTRDNGVGIRFTEGSLAQHPVLRRVTAQGCIRGLDLNHIAQGDFNQVSAFQCIWLGATITSCQISWRGGNLQTVTSSTATRPFAVSAGMAYNIVSGFERITGLDSGTGATLSTTSGGLCTLTGMSGLDKVTDRGRWVRLTDPAPLSPDKVSWYYKIVSVLSATSCTVLKASDHTSRTVDWQICSTAGGSNVEFAGTYDEGSKRASFGFFRDEVSASVYAVRNAIAANCTYSIDADGCQGSIEESNVVQSDGLRTRDVAATTSDRSLSQITYNDSGYPGLVCRSNMISGGFNSGLRDSNGGRARRVRQLVKELGAAEAWDARATSTLTLSTLDVTAWAGVINGRTLGPTFATKYSQYEAADATLGACVAIGGAETGGNVKSLIGTLPTNILPSGSDPFTGTLFAVLRLDSTTVSPNTRRIEAYSTGSANIYQNLLALNDDSLTTNDWYCGVYDGSQTLQATLGASVAADTSPHAFVCGVSAAGNIRLSSDFYGTEWTAGNGTPTAGIGFVPATSITIELGAQYGTGALGKFYLAFLAFFPRALTEAEHRQLIDTARNEWPLVK